MTGPNRARIDPTIIAALIGVCGTVTVALISIIAPRLVPQPTVPTALPTLTSVVIFTPTITDTPLPTDTVPPGDPTSTPAPVTPTLEPTFTPIPPPPIGMDWAIGCISALWIPYPPSILSEQRDGCLSQPLHKFVANNGRLAFLYDDRVNTAEYYGLFALLPADGTASVKVLLSELERGEIWMGIFSAPDISSAGMILAIPPGNINRRPIVQRSMPTQETILESINFQQDPPIYDVSFSFNSNSVEANVMNNSLPMNPFALTSAQKYLFIGYQVRNGGNRIGAEFYELVIQAR